MTRQEMFNKAYLGVMRQGALCKDADGMCAYASNGRRCGVGHLLSEEQLRLIALRPKLNTTPVSWLASAEVLPPEFDLDFAEELQRMHDLALTLEEFIMNMRRLALIVGLYVPHPDHVSMKQPIEALP